MAIECVKLLDGEELIGEITFDVQHDRMIIKNPARIILTQGKDDKPTLMMIPWILYSEKKEYAITQDGLLCDPFTPTRELRNAYSEQFGSGIVLPISPEPDTKQVLLG